MTLPGASFATAATQYLNLKTPCEKIGLADNWSQGFLACVEAMQTLTLGSGDQDSITWLVANRKLFKNNELTSVTIEYNGEAFVFASETVYCASAGEAAFFIQMATANGLDFTYAAPMDFGSDGEVMVFFE